MSLALLLVYTDCGAIYRKRMEELDERHHWVSFIQHSGRLNHANLLQNKSMKVAELGVETEWCAISRGKLVSKLSRTSSNADRGILGARREQRWLVEDRVYEIISTCTTYRLTRYQDQPPPM